jgi:hypothetical protein
MNFSRRRIFGASALAVTAAGFSGCGLVTINQGTVTVNLANAQAEAKAIYSALTAFVAELTNTLQPGMKAEAETAYADLGKVVAVFAVLPNGSSTIPQAAQAVIAAVQSLVPLLPLPVATTSAISTGLLLISALIAGVSSITVPAPAVVVGVRAVPVVSGPIPIPLG